MGDLFPRRALATRVEAQPPTYCSSPSKSPVERTMSYIGGTPACFNPHPFWVSAGTAFPTD